MTNIGMLKGLTDIDMELITCYSFPPLDSAKLKGIIKLIKLNLTLGVISLIVET